MIGQAVLKFNKYFEVARISYYENTTYFGDVLGMAGLVAARIWIFSQLYTVVFRLASINNLGGLTFAQTIWILALAQSFHTSNRTRRTMTAIDRNIKDGTIAYTINKPYSYVLFNFFTCLGVVGGYLFMTILLSGLVAMIVVGGVKFSIVGILAGMLLLVFGFVINTLFALIIGLLGFWAEDVSAFRWIYDKFLWVLGGLFLPLSAFPIKAQKLIEILPFNQMFYGPARIMVSYDVHLFVRYLLIQLIWVLILSLLVKYIYNKGIKNLSINGG